jgi:DNA-binding helix-hairpin-helix protein with protein kinase domain
MEPQQEATMNSDENAPPLASAYDDLEARLTKQENLVVDLRCELALFRQQTDSNFETLRLQLANAVSKAEFQASMAALEQRLTERILQETRRVEAKLDSMVRWIIGLQLTTIALVAALVGYGYLN